MTQFRFPIPLAASLLAALLCSTVALAGNGKLVAIEEVVETTSFDVQLPSSTGGIALLRRCRSCKQTQHRATAATAYFIGERPVPLADLRAAVSRRQSAMLFGYRRSTGELTRVIVMP